MTLKQYKSELKKLIHFFKAREEFKDELSLAIEKYGLAGIPRDILRSIPVDPKALKDRQWYFYPRVWIKILVIAFLNAENENMKKVLNNG